MRIVCPSGLALAAVRMPMFIAAPGIFSTKNGLPNFSESLCAMMRASTSLCPPGEARHDEAHGTFRVSLGRRHARHAEKRSRSR